jgi:hypothetical protein
VTRAWLVLSRPGLPAIQALHAECDRGEIDGFTVLRPEILRLYPYPVAVVRGWVDDATFAAMRLAGVDVRLAPPEGL